MKKWRCTVCGQVFEGEHPPVPCSVCGANEESFELLEDTAVSHWRCTVCGQNFEGAEPPVPCPVCGAGREAFEEIKTEKAQYKQDTQGKFVLIGGGLAALAAAKAIRQRNATASITMVCGEGHYPYNRPALSGLIADTKPIESVLLEKETFYTDHSIEMKTGVVVEAVDMGEKTAKLSDGSELPYTKLLLATGSVPFNPIKRGENSVPVQVLRRFEDAMELAARAKGKRVVLVGGGILGLEAAVALRKIGCSVTIVEFAPRILPLQTDEAVARMLAQKLEAFGIRLICGASVALAEAHGVVLSDGAELATDYVLASMGVRSEVSLAAIMGLNLSRGIVVDEFMHTSHADVWAAGDCAEYNGKVQAMAGAASGMGAVAGASMAGDESVPYKPFIPATAFSFPGFSLFSVGVVNMDTEESVLYRNEQDESYRRLFFVSGKLSGALFVGKNPGAKAVAALSAGVTLEEAIQLLV